MLFYNNIFSEDSDCDDNGHEIKSKEIDDSGNDDDGIFGLLEGQILGTNEPRAKHALNNNIDGQNFKAFNWDGFLDDDTVGGVYARNHFPMPSDDGDVCNIQSSKNHDDVSSDDDASDNNVCNGNDDDRDNNVQNENGEKAPNNIAVGGDVEVVPQGLQNDVS